MSDLSKRIRGLRELKGLDKSEVADNAGIPRSNITRYEDGLSEPNLESLKKLKDFFGVEYEDLLGDIIHKCTNDGHHWRYIKIAGYSIGKRECYFCGLMQEYKGWASMNKPTTKEA